MSLGRYIAIALVVFVFSPFAPALIASPTTSDPLTAENCAFGDVYQFADAGCAITLKNNGATPLTVSLVPVQPGNTVTPAKLTLPAHGQAQVVTHVRTDNIAGQIGWTYRIEGAGQNPFFVQAQGFVMSVVDVARPSIAFGSVEPAAMPATQSITLASSVYPQFRVTKIASSASFLHANISSDGKTLTATIGPDAPWGVIDETVKLDLDTPVQREVWVQVTASVDGDIGPKKNPYWLGTIPWNAKRTLIVPLAASDGRPFEIGSVTSKEFAATFSAADCGPAQPACRNLLVHVADTQAAGFFKDEFNVDLPDRKKHLNLVLWGVLSERSEPGQPSAAPQNMTKVPIPETAPDSVTTPPPLKVQPEPDGTGPLLKWTLAQQGSVHGYQVFRGDSAEGPFTLMGAHMLEVLDNGTGPVKYQWRDSSAKKGQTYWYYVAVVYKSGDRSALSGPQKTTAK